MSAVKEIYLVNVLAHHLQGHCAGFDECQEIKRYTRAFKLVAVISMGELRATVLMRQRASIKRACGGTATHPRGLLP
ncbi:MAG TPA: hypothetical protein VJ023_04125 [Pyrinomonadaceae bacterium]|nr:hypothetical protein [Pyrinomonadaceae bacterium]